MAVLYWFTRLPGLPVGIWNRRGNREIYKSSGTPQAELPMKVRHFQNKYVESLTNLTKFNPHERGTVRSHKPVRLAEDCREIEIIRVLKKSIIISFDLACISK